MKLLNLNEIAPLNSTGLAGRHMPATDVTHLFIHCTATPPNNYINSMERVDDMHRGRGWDACGYHAGVLEDGTIEGGRPLDRTGAHAGVRWNYRSIAIVMFGGLDSLKQPTAKYTQAQWDRTTLLALSIYYSGRFPNLKHVIGHRDVANKACPCFAVAPWWGEVKGDYEDGLLVERAKAKALAEQEATLSRANFELAEEEAERDQTYLDIANLELWINGEKWIRG